MHRYLLPGSEFRDAVNSLCGELASAVQEVEFNYTDSLPRWVLDLNQVAVCYDGSDDVKMCVSEDGYTVFVHSDYDVRCLDCQMMFYRMSQLKCVRFCNFNTDECNTMRRMFMGCTSLKHVDMHHLSSDDVEDFTSMFSGCSSLKSVDVSMFRVPSSKESCTFSDMFKGCSSLRRITVGGNFFFNASMSLTNPDRQKIPESDGTWHFPLTGKSYDSSELQGGLAGTYYACDVASSSLDSSLVTVGALKSAISAVSAQFDKTLRYLSSN